MLVTGGYTSFGGRGAPITDQAEVYDPVKDWWRAVAKMSRARYGHTATALSDGRVLVVGGGGNGDAPDTMVQNTAEIYDLYFSLTSGAPGRPCKCGRKQKC